MADQVFTDGEIHPIGDKAFECVGVSYSESDGVKTNFVYSFRLKAELDEERRAAQEATEAAAEEARLTAEKQVIPTEGDQ